MSKKKQTTFRYAWLLRQWDKILFLGMLGAFIVLSPGKAGIAKFADVPLPLKSIPFPVPTPAPLPVNTTGLYPGGEVTAESVVVYDVDSGTLMYGRNAQEVLAPASTTKIMTALVALEHYKLDDVVTVPNLTTDGQLMGLFPGEKMTVQNLLYGALVYSANDAAWTLASYYPGGEPAFVAAMNEKAQELRLTHSHFTNPVGYDNPEHKMTAEDLAHLAAYALTNETIAEIVAIPQITISDVTYTHFYPLTNVNQLLGVVPGVAGMKTGWTEEAGQNLVTLIDRNGHRVITVVLKSQDRFADTKSLIQWIFSNYTWKSFSPAG